MLALVRATATTGSIKVTATADGVPPATVILTTAPIDKEDVTIAKAAALQRGF